jgi:sec-independent protein translocase protein TatB
VFGIGFFEFMVIMIVAVLFLGPDKLPQAIVKIVRTFKTFSKSINDAKAAIEEEINLQELKEDSKKYRALLEKNTEEIRKKLSFDELDALSEVNSTIAELKSTVEGTPDAVIVPDEPAQVEHKKPAAPAKPKKPKGGE